MLGAGSTLFLGICLSLGSGACSFPLETAFVAGDPPPISSALGSRAAFVSAEIARFNVGLGAADRAEKYGQMALSAFNFYRGTDHLYWADHAGHPDLFDFGVDIFISGDLHVGNLGSYGDDLGNVVFGMNDYDQAVIADYQLDLWRLAVSLVLVGRSDGLSAAKIREAVDAMVEAYLDQLDDDRKNHHEADRIFDAGATTGAIDDLLKKAAEKTRADLLDKWTTAAGGTRAFDLSSADLAAVSAGTRSAVVAALPGYRASLHSPLPAGQFAVKSVAQRRHAGLGSLGLARYYVLIEGPSASDNDDVILDIKAEPPAYAAAFQPTPAFASEGERAATAQRALDVHVDDYLGWTRMGQASFLVRSLSPAKDSLTESHYRKAADFKSVARQLGPIVATFHARSDRDFRAELIPYDFESAVFALTDGHHADFRALTWAHASSYADQVTADWNAFKSSTPP